MLPWCLSRVTGSKECPCGVNPVQGMHRHISCPASPNLSYLIVIGIVCRAMHHLS